MTAASKTIVSTLQRFDSNLWHFHVMIPKKFASPFVKGNNRRVVCTLNKTITFHAALMPDGEGAFFINVNQEVRKKLRLKEGDEVLVSLNTDDSEYGLPIPEEFKELLKQDTKGNDLFHALTPGKQRTMLYFIGKPKSADLRIRNGIAVLEHLKNNKGQIDFKQLNEDIRRMQ